MRAQMMSFSNDDGAGVSLNVPDTNEVKEVFSAVVTTVVQQQKQITTLQTTMKQMAEDHAKSQEALIAWTAQCVNDLVAQNLSTESRLQDAKQQLKNMSYNVQGFVDDVDNAPPPPAPIEIRPPLVYRTATPKIICDPMEVGEGNGDTLFPTETGAAPDASLNVSENPRWGGPTSGGAATMAGAQETKPHRKSDQQRAQAKAFYQSVKASKLPKTATERWRWAFRKVLGINRTKLLKVGMTRGKAPLHKTAAERLERIETELFTIPIVLREFISKETGKLYIKIADEVTKIESELELQKAETSRLCAALQANIDVVSENLTQVDNRLIALQEQVDNANKQADEVERKLNAIISRVGEHEMCLFDSIRSRITDMVVKVESMKGQAATTTGKLDLLAQQEQQVQVEVEEAQANPDSVEDRSAEEGHKLFEMLDYDTLLRSARIEINALDSSAFAVAEILRALRYELLSTSVLAGPDESVDKDKVNEMLASCDAVAAVLDTIFQAVQASNELWEGHDRLLASRWKTLSGVADAVKMVATMSATLDDVRQTIETMPTTDAVKDMAEKIAMDVSGKAIENALLPVDEKIEDVRGALGDLTGEIKSVKEEVAASASRASAMPTNLDAQIEPLVQKLVEMYIGSGSGPGISTGDVGNTRNTKVKPTRNNNQIDEVDYIFTADELELAYASDIIDDETANHELEQGTLVRVIAGKHMNRQGIIFGALPSSRPGISGLPEAKNSDEHEDGAESTFGDATEIAGDVMDRVVRYRVNLVLDSPLQTPQIRSNDDDSGLIPPAFGELNFLPDETEDFLPDESNSSSAMPASRVGFSSLQKEVDKLASKIEDILAGAINVRPSDIARAVSRGNQGGEIDPSVMATISSSIQDVLAQLGDLRELQEKELSKAKTQMKQAILVAINKAITDKDAEDKESFLTTRAMCVGCGRSSLVRKADNSLPAVSLGFNPALNSGSIPGPDVYRYLSSTYHLLTYLIIDVFGNYYYPSLLIPKPYP